MSGDDELLQAALSAREHAYAPYSRFAVGAALRDEQGRIHAGCNVENAAYPQGLCAEAVALGRLVADGGRQRRRGGGGGRGGGAADALRRLPPEAGRVRQRRDARALRQLRRRAALDDPWRIAARGLRRRSLAGPDVNADIETSAGRLRQAAGGVIPALALVLGSGWSAAAERMQVTAAVDYAALPAFPTLGVAGHAGVLRIGRLAGVPVCLLGGRKHAYEDGDAAAMKGAIRSLAAAGARVLLQTNAAGSLDPALPPGSLMLVGDHLNVVQRTPLHRRARRRPFRRHGRRLLPAAARRRRWPPRPPPGCALSEGVYAWVLGPQFETPAEIRMLQRLGARAVGMSTVPETILARHAGLRVLALSMITNMGCGLSDESLSHAHTLARAKAASGDAARLLEALLPSLEA